ncbi:MAG: guanylate kinase [Actinomycetes bacterium]
MVLIGPGGTGKGTVAARLLEGDDSLWLSRSWTTRPPRVGEDPEAYVFVDRPTFQAHADKGGFLEFAEFLDHLYGTPVPDPPDGRDVLLEIDLEGARQVSERRPHARVVLLVPPSEEVQAERLRGRGDDEAHVERRVEKGREEIAEGRRLAHHEVVNDDLEQAVVRVLDILNEIRFQNADESSIPEER